MSNTASPLASCLAATPSGITALSHLGVIRAAGEEAARFLQGQLTQDVALQAVGSTRLAAFCDPRGRMLASFLVLKRATDELLLITSADTLPATLRRLSMFVLRAKLKLSDATHDFMLYGLLGTAASEASSEKTATASAPASLIALPAAGKTARALWLAPAGTPAPAGTALTQADWLRAEVLAGVARITQPVAQAFVPQMLNYESVDGISFKKGCYPGQEVVARSQFRGVIKRRAFVGKVAGPAKAGQYVFVQGDEQPAGLIAQAAPCAAGDAACETIAIVSLQLSAQHAPALHVGSASGPALSDLHLPYALREDI